MIERDLTGMIPLTTKSNSLLVDLANTITTFSNVHLEQNVVNERKQEAELEDKNIETLLSGSKRTQLKNIIQLEEGSDVEDDTP